MRRAHLAITIAWAVLGLAVACSDSESDPASPPSNELDAATPETSAPDATEPRDAAADGPRDATYDAADEPVACAVAPCAVAITAGYSHACALLGDKTVRCWGANFKGALGAGEDDAGPRDPGSGPVAVAGLTDVEEIGAAGFTTCARRTDGRVLCWGANERGQLGLSVEPAAFDADAHPTPSPVALGGSAARIEIGNDTSCAHLVSGEIWCWGANEQNQLLRKQSSAAGGPGILALGGEPVHWPKTAFASLSGYGVTEDRGLLSWGFIFGRNTSAKFDPEPQPLAGLSGIVDIAASPASIFVGSAKGHACVIAGGQVYCWGRTLEGEVPALCTGVPNDQRVPVVSPLSGAAFPQQIAVSWVTTCARLTDGTVECCGDDAHGQLGLGKVSTNPSVLPFTRATALTGYAVRVVTGQTMTCALLRGGEVMCWGGNERGELGRRTVDSDPHPVPVAVSF